MPVVSERDYGRDGRPLPESALEAYLDIKMKKLGGKSIKIAPLVKGNPDRLVIVPYGRMYFVEMKTFVGRPAPAQVVWHDRMAAMGHVVHVVNTKAKVERFVRYIMATGAGLKDGRRQAEKDLEATLRGYPYKESDEDE